jgi:GNAT superfamily N-acetyltransferase
MLVRRLKLSDSSSLEAYLSAHTTTCMYMRSNLAKSGIHPFNGQAYQGEYWACFDRSIIIGVLAHYWNHNIIVQTNNDEALDCLLEFIGKRLTRPVAGILGPEEQAARVIRALGLLDRGEFNVNDCQNLYELDLGKLKFPNVRGLCRITGVDENDRDLLTKWLRAFNIEAVHSQDDDKLTAYVERVVRGMIDDGNAWILSVEDIPVSLVGFNATLSDTVQIGPVWTPPEYRCKGYARVLLALALEQARDKGVERAILFTGNPAGAKAYESIGFSPCGQYRIALLKDPVRIEN